MNRAEFIFIVVDALFHNAQNTRRNKSIEVVKDYSFSDCKESTADLYFKSGVTDAPIIINVHGGGFVKGDKKHRRSLSEDYANLGFFVINTNYRLSPKNIYPSAVEDVFTILNNLSKLKDTYSINTDKVILTGDSAGAYLAAHTVAALTNEELRLGLKLPECSIKPYALISFCGPYDIKALLTTRVAFNLTHTIAESMTGLKLDKKLRDIDKYELINYLSTTDFITENWCKTFVVYAEKDIFCKGQGEIFIEKLKEKNIDFKFQYSKTLFDNHCYHLTRRSKKSKETMKEVFKFLEEIK